MLNSRAVGHNAAKVSTVLIALFVSGPIHADDWTFMDDRSSPQKLVESYYFAINNGYYVQAYGYFRNGSAPQNFNTWVKGYADTKTVSVKFGATAPDPGAGQIYWALPVAIETLLLPLVCKASIATGRFTGPCPWQSRPCRRAARARSLPGATKST